jgi:hypothetical protein
MKISKTRSPRAPTLFPDKWHLFERAFKPIIKEVRSIVRGTLARISSARAASYLRRRPAASPSATFEKLRGVGTATGAQSGIRLARVGHELSGGILVGALPCRMRGIVADETVVRLLFCSACSSSTRPVSQQSSQLQRRDL